jgi:GNAT superfamily N-acetyltransferase
VNGVHLCVESLIGKHDRPGFSCGVPSLDRYIHQQAGQDVRRNLAVCYVLCVPRSEPSLTNGSVPIIGYYTLSMTAIRPSALSEAPARKLGRYDSYPALLLGRLAVDARYRGAGHGEYLPLDAMRRAVHASKDAGTIALVVDAIDEGAAQFYRRFEFVRFEDEPLRLYLPIASCRKAIEFELSPDEVERPLRRMLRRMAHPVVWFSTVDLQRRGSRLDDRPRIQRQANAGDALAQGAGLIAVVVRDLPVGGGPVIRASNAHAIRPRKADEEHSVRQDQVH